MQRSGRGIQQNYGKIPGFLRRRINLGEEIWYKLNNITYKLNHLNLDFHQLTSEELKFWKKFKQEDIFEWLSGSPIHPPDYTEYIRI